MNKVLLVGRLGNEVTMRYAASGMAILKRTIEVAESYASKGELKTEVHEIPLVAFGEIAERIGKLDEGALVSMTCRLTMDTYTGNDGKERTRMQVVVGSCTHLEVVERLQAGHAPPERVKNPGKPAAPAPTPKQAPLADMSDDIPF